MKEPESTLNIFSTCNQAIVVWDSHQEDETKPWTLTFTSREVRCISNHDTLAVHGHPRVGFWK